MDQKKFDELTRKLTDGASRRGVVRGLLGGATAGIATAVGLSAADAKRNILGRRSVYLETDPPCLEAPSTG